MRRQKIFVYLIVFFIALSIILISRKIIFKSIFEKIITRTENRYDLQIKIDKANLSGFRTIYLTGMEVKTIQGYTILKSDSVAINIKPFPLLVGKIRISSLNIYNTHISGDIELIRFFSNKRKTTNINDTINKSAPINYTEWVNNVLEKAMGLIPGHIVLRNTSLSYSNDSISATVVFENFIYQNKKYLGDILFSDKISHSHCFVSGDFNPAEYTFSSKIHKRDANTITRLPYIGQRWQAALCFDSLSLAFTYYKNDKYSVFKGLATANNLLLFHQQVSPDTIKINSGKFKFNWYLNNNSIELDSASTVQLNWFSFSPYLKIQKDTSTKISLSFIRKEFEASDLFHSLPEGLFSNFKGIETKGKLAFQLKTSVDLQHPENVVFQSKLENMDFAIKKYGCTDFRIMNGSFNHEVYEKNRLITSFMVGPENPDFVSISEISPYLKYSVLTSEDGDFFYHKGFNEKAFAESITKNISEGRFARGGSTISMQLVKNVFLNRKKVISRKIEEALIVWIIENLRLTTKERMFEVYLNIIEWGPGIYGIKNASKFYFNKLPKDLTLSESIYLSSLIPRPKGFKYTFDQNGQLREYLHSYYQLVSGIMVRRNQITSNDTINLEPISKLTGEAKNFLSKPDSTSTDDSLFFLKPLNLPAIQNEF